MIRTKHMFPLLYLHLSLLEVISHMQLSMSIVLDLIKVIVYFVPW